MERREARFYPITESEVSLGDNWLNGLSVILWSRLLHLECGLYLGGDWLNPLVSHSFGGVATLASCQIQEQRKKNTGSFGQPDR